MKTFETFYRYTKKNKKCSFNDLYCFRRRATSHLEESFNDLLITFSPSSLDDAYPLDPPLYGNNIVMCHIEYAYKNHQFDRIRFTDIYKSGYIC